MSIPTKLFQMGQLAEASYANLVGGNDVLLAELQNTANNMKFSLTQASVTGKGGKGVSIN